MPSKTHPFRKPHPGHNLCEVLDRKEISNKELARRLKEHPNHIGRYFKPDYDVKLSTLRRWAKATGVKVRELIKE